MSRRKTPNEELFALVLKHWQALPSEREKASFLVSVLADERFAELLPFMVDAALSQLELKDTARGGSSQTKLTRRREDAIREVFSTSMDDWNKRHPGASGLKDEQRAWRFAVGRTAARTGADPRTIKRRFPDPLERARARNRALVQALREGSPRR
jgi:hypothetical protein